MLRILDLMRRNYAGEALVVFDDNLKNFPLATLFTGKAPDKRMDIATPNRFLQMAIIPLKLGQEIRPHSHNLQTRTIDRTEEIWILLRGRAEVRIYNSDKSINRDIMLKPGAILHLFGGGHSLRPISRKIVLYEVKNGPYTGPKNDRTFF